MISLMAAVGQLQSREAGRSHAIITNRGVSLPLPPPAPMCLPTARSSLNGPLLASQSGGVCHVGAIKRQGLGGLRAQWLRALLMNGYPNPHGSIRLAPDLTLPAPFRPLWSVHVQRCEITVAMIQVDRVRGLPLNSSEQQDRRTRVTPEFPS